MVGMIKSYHELEQNLRIFTFENELSTHFNEFAVEFHDVLDQRSVFSQQSPPVTLDVFHPQVFPDHFVAAQRDFLRQLLMFFKEFDEVFQIFRRAFAVDRNVMHPRFEGFVEEFLPLIANVKHERLAQEKMFQPETRSDASIIKQKLELAMIFERNFVGGFRVERVGG